MTKLEVGVLVGVAVAGLLALAVLGGLGTTQSTVVQHATLTVTTYGAPLADVETVPIAELVANPAAYDGKQVRVEGVVTDVCAKRGCWIEIAAEGADASVTFKVTDGVIVFPMSETGKHAVADGTVRKVEMTLEKTRAHLAHQAEEQGAPFDPETVTEAMTTIRLDGISARISSVPIAAGELRE